MSYILPPLPWKAIPSPHRSDSWFVVEDVPAQPYPGGGGAFPGEPPRMQLPPAVVKCGMPEKLAVLVAKAPELRAALAELVVELDGITRNEYEGTDEFEPRMAELKAHRDLLELAGWPRARADLTWLGAQLYECQKNVERCRAAPGQTFLGHDLGGWERSAEAIRLEIQRRGGVPE